MGSVGVVVFDLLDACVVVMMIEAVALARQMSLYLRLANLSILARNGRSPSIGIHHVVNAIVGDQQDVKHGTGYIVHAGV